MKFPDVKQFMSDGNPLVYRLSNFNGVKKCFRKSMARNLKIILAYDGLDFAGWQVQPGQATIQGTLMSAIEHLTGEKTLPQGSGRTDAGVHALAQVASLALECPIPPENLRKALNDVLPKSIRILSIEAASRNFMRASRPRQKPIATGFIVMIVCPPFLARYVYHYPYPLNEEHMVRAAALVVGTHDFTSFAAVDPRVAKRKARTQIMSGPFIPHNGKVMALSLFMK